MKIITCAGYYGTGSSAVTDLLGEFDNIHFMGDYEFRFVQDPWGIADLEYNIVENYHRHNSGYALKMYKKNVDFLSGSFKRYESFFNGQFKKLSYEYIDSLTSFKFKGYWHQDVIDKGLLFWFFERLIYKIANKILVPIIRNGQNKEPITFSLMEIFNEQTFVPVADKDFFYSVTRDYIDKLFTAANSDNKEFVMVDQIVPPSNTNKYSSFFHDIKIIVVDRDPRDIYLLEKEIWKGKCVPTENVTNFCKWYELTRHHLKNEKDNPQKVLRVQFEDMVYHYQETTEKIMSFLGLNKVSHISPQSKFIPAESVRNTQLWKNYPELKSDIESIEKSLNQFCYNNY